MKQKLKIKYEDLPLWLRYGVITSCICILLFLVYLYIYFPLIAQTNQAWPHTRIPEWGYTPTLLTGHLFVFLSGMSTPVELFCQPTEQKCFHWQNKDMVPKESECISWPDLSGDKNLQGCCLDLNKVPSSACTENAQQTWGWMLAIALFLVYFSIGAVLGLIIQRKIKKRNKKK